MKVKYTLVVGHSITVLPSTPTGCGQGGGSAPRVPDPRPGFTPLLSCLPAVFPQGGDSSCISLSSSVRLGVFVAQLFRTLCVRMDCCSPPGSSVHGQVASDMSSNEMMVRISGVLNNRLGTHTHTRTMSQEQQRCCGA